MLCMQNTSHMERQIISFLMFCIGLPPCVCAAPRIPPSARMKSREAFSGRDQIDYYYGPSLYPGDVIQVYSSSTWQDPSPLSFISLPSTWDGELGVSDPPPPPLWQHHLVPEPLLLFLFLLFSQFCRRTKPLCKARSHKDTSCKLIILYLIYVWMYFLLHIFN